MKGKWIAAVTLLVMLAWFLPALSLRLHEQSETGLMITPGWEKRILAFGILTALTPAVALLVAAVRQTLRLSVVLPLVGLLLAGIVGGLALMTVLTHNFIFPDVYVRTEKSGPQELHLYKNVFLSCSARVYAAPKGAIYGRLVLNEGVECGREWHARWTSDGGVELQ